MCRNIRDEIKIVTRGQETLKTGQADLKLNQTGLVCITNMVFKITSSLERGPHSRCDVMEGQLEETRGDCAHVAGGVDPEHVSGPETEGRTGRQGCRRGCQ